jgi:hypothetical protein
MKIKDWNVFCSTAGKQSNLVLGLAILAVVDFILLGYLEKFGFPVLIAALLQGVTGVLAIYYLAYAIVLTRRIVEKEYK